MSTSRIPHAGFKDDQSRDAAGRDADAEILSALFDGQLRDDAARFALRRLGHDAAWREACGRWQLAGDVLRGQADAAAPAGFAGRVMAAVAQEHPLAVAEYPYVQGLAPAGPGLARPPVRAHRRWIGGAALAASVAMAALFVARPVFQAGVPEVDAPRQAFAVDTTSADPAQAASTPMTVADATTDAPGLRDAVTAPAGSPGASPAGGAALAAAAAVAVADVPRRAGDRRARGQAQRAALRGSQHRQGEAVVAVASPTTAPTAALAAEAGAAAAAADARPTLRPFMPAGEVVSRPWPQAVLPRYAGGAALTASYHDGGESGPVSPSFYPFEPQALQDHASAAPAPGIRPVEPQR